jgi:hypothetical protein
LRLRGCADLRLGHGLVNVGADPQAVVAVWLRGLTDRNCVAETTQRGAIVAVRLAADIRHASAFPSGNVNCPNDDGSARRIALLASRRTRRAGTHRSVGMLEDHRTSSRR